MEISSMKKDQYSISTLSIKGRYKDTLHLAEDNWPVSTCTTPV